MKTINQDQQKLFDALKARDKKLLAAWNGERGVFKTLKGAFGKLAARQKPAALALNFVKQFSHLLGPKAAASSYAVFREIKRSDGGTLVSINYSVNGLVVLSGRIVAEVDKGGVLKKLTSSLPRSVVVEGKPTVTEKSLYALLMERFRTHPDSVDYLEEHGKDAKRSFPFPATSQPRMVLWRMESGVYHPAWMGLAILPADQVYPVGEKKWMLSQAEYYVDATDGAFLKVEPTMEFADVAVNVQGRAVIRDGASLVTVSARGIRRDGGDRYLKNIDKDIDIITFDAAGNDTNTGTELRDGTMAMSRDADGDWSTSTSNCAAADRTASQQPEIDLHRFATQIYEFYDGLGWKGFDNEGWDTCPVRAVAHIGHDANAYFDKFAMTGTGNMHGYIAFFDGECDGGVLQYDFIAGDLGIVAHEYQHAITYFAVTKATGEPGGLYSDTIRGAFREGYSDSFAGLISGRWINPAPAPDGVCAAGLPFRRVEYPRSSDTKDGDTYCDHYDDIGDLNDKYYKSTTLSHTAFLLAQGGVHDRPARSPQYIPVPPIGVNATSRIWLTALREKLDGLAAGGGDARMVDVGNYLLEAAEDEFGNRSKEYVLLRRALHAVGLYPYDTTVSPYTKDTYGGEACMLPWGWDWRRSQEYLALPLFRHWQSMDLFIDNGDGVEYDATIGAENKVFARVRNIGDQAIDDVSVEFWYRKAGSALPASETDWRRCEDSLGNPCTKVIASIAAGASTFDDVYGDADAVNWFLDPAEISDEVDHFCLRAKIVCAAANHDNDYENYVQSNVHHVLADAGDADGLIAFRVANLDKKKPIPLDLVVEHSLPKGAVVRPKENLTKVVLQPGEERTVSFNYYVPKSALSKLRPPYDGEVVGELYGELCGRFAGNLSKVVIRAKGRIEGVLSMRIGDIGSATGRFEGRLDLKRMSIEGRARVSFAPYIASKLGHSIRIVGIKARLSPVRVINFTQRVNGEVVGGVTVNIVTKPKA